MSLAPSLRSRVGRGAAGNPLPLLKPRGHNRLDYTLPGPTGEQAYMQDLNNIRTQLAQEEAALESTSERIREAHQRIQEAHSQIAAIQAQIEAAQGQIQELQKQSQTIEKRIALLREYMEMAASARIPTPPPAPAPQPATPAARPAPSETGAEEELGGELLPEFEKEDEIGALEFDEPLTASTDNTNPPTTERGPVTFENIDEELLTDEVLPRTTTFEEELVLVMAYVRKAVKAKDIAGKFRRLDYAPKVSATVENIKQQVEANNQYFEFVAGGRIALTEEGREEARRLLKALV